MQTHEKPAFLNHFENLDDPRIDRKKLYPLDEILLTVLCGSICGAQSWRDFVLFGQEKQDFLLQFLPYKNGMPSKNTYARVLSSLAPEKFKACFIGWVQSFQKALGSMIAIDGKTLRKSFDKATDQSAIHMVSAFASDAKLVLGQQKVSGKSNEITAIPKLLDLLSLEGTTVTIDAMGTQKKIAAKIIDKKADYVLALKRNHSDLYKDVELFFSKEIKDKSSPHIIEKFEEFDKGHGRIEKRICYTSSELSWLDKREDWCGLESISMVESEVIKGGKRSYDRRYFISSLSADPRIISHAVRSHWSIENSLHWVLDVTLNEDNSRVRKDHAAENMAMIRHITLNMLQNTKKTYKDISLKALQKKAGWGDPTLHKILMKTF